MVADQRMTRQQQRKKNKEFFIRNAFLIIKKMDGLSPARPSVLVDELLHSIFFLGKINKNSCTPEDIVTDEGMLNKLKGRYPRPFQLYSSQLPKRSPMSCVLDMTVELTGQENENEIKERLQELILKLKEGRTNQLVSSTICVSQVKDSVRYYGVSMSTSDHNPGKIMVAASCLSAWHSYVAGAVMTYYSKDNRRKLNLPRKKPYFDRTIKLPQQVRCQAFNLSDGREKPPCRSCGILFGLPTSEKKEWPYGNCAEAESLSNLLKNENEVKNQVRPPSPPRRGENQDRGKTEKRVLEELKDLLKAFKPDWENWNGEFYIPQIM